jgi:putative tryptophan/tyrosine transport system substrate-binding protein
MPVVGILNLFSRPLAPWKPGQGPVEDGLREAGYIAGQNVTFEYRFAGGHRDMLPALAADFVDRKVDVIVTIGGTPPALVAKSATSTIPIVFTDVGDPVGIGLVASLARPGGNLTGFSNLNPELIAKRVELLSEIVPRASVIALFQRDRSIGESDQCNYRERHQIHTASDAREGHAVLCLECRDRRRDRRRLHFPRRATSRRTRCRR